VQSRDSDVDFMQTQNERQEQGTTLQRLFDVSLDAFEDFLAGLHDLYQTTAELCRALHDGRDATDGSDGGAGSPTQESEHHSARMPRRRSSFGGAPASQSADIMEAAGSQSVQRGMGLRRHSLSIIPTRGGPTMGGSNGQGERRHQYHPRRSQLLQLIFRSVDEDQDGRINFSALHRAMDQELSLDVRVDQVRPLFDTFHLTGDDGCMDLDEFVDFLVTYLRIKFGSTIAHLVTDTKAFADYLGISNVGGDDFSASAQRKRALLAQAIASDATTTDGRRNSLDALAVGQQMETPQHQILLLPGLQLPAEITESRGTVAARKMIAESIVNIFKCPPEMVAVHEDEQGRKNQRVVDEYGGDGASTVTASVGGLHSAKLGAIIADLINDHAYQRQRQAIEELKLETGLSVRDVRIRELESLVGNVSRQQKEIDDAHRAEVDDLRRNHALQATTSVSLNIDSKSWESRAVQAEEAALAATKETAKLQAMLDTVYRTKPEGLSTFAEKLWASTSIATAQLDCVRRDMASLANTTNGLEISAVDQKMHEMVAVLADLLLSANARVCKALDDEGALKQYMKRLESKITQVTKAMASAEIAKQTIHRSPVASSPALSDRNAFPSAARQVSENFASEHTQCLQDLVRNQNTYDVVG
jgi:hypothetical protein